MVGRHTDNLNVAGSDIHEETGTLQAGVLTVDKTASNLHGKDRLHFHEAELRDSNLLLQLRENRSSPSRSRFLGGNVLRWRLSRRSTAPTTAPLARRRSLR